MQVSADEVKVLRWHNDTVRDCSWHPQQAILASVSWDGCVVEWAPGASGVEALPANATRRLRGWY
jgi:hypothetical protein